MLAQPLDKQRKQLRLRPHLQFQVPILAVHAHGFRGDAHLAGGGFHRQNYIRDFYFKGGDVGINTVLQIPVPAAPPLKMNCGPAPR